MGCYFFDFLILNPCLQFTNSLCGVIYNVRQIDKFSLDKAGALFTSWASAWSTFRQGFVDYKVVWAI